MKRVCVFCGSSPGVNPAYLEAARALGGALAARKIGLVYGGSSVGLMGAVADAVLASGGEAVGVLPRGLEAREVGHSGLTELHLVGSMHERKAKMADLADGFIAMPGGLGTLEELFEIWTWALLGVHQKPVGLLDTAGYYAPLIAFVDHAVREGFVRETHRTLVVVDGAEAALLDKLAAYTPPDLPKWVAAGRT